ncbi:MAG: hypothetical protein FJZ04_04540, partial [Candidatus Moranbacteria bacterium]|nr:hypothetical protein [Candidatus Moranbacteria bacterium]
MDKLLHSSTVVAPIKSRLEIIRPENAAKIDLTGFRAIEPFKAFSFKITETIARYFGEDEPLHKKNLVFLGARGCDLEAQEVLDRVNLEGEFADPFYSAGRENILLIGADCTACGSTCFCTLMRGKPYATKLFDLNLSWVENGYAVEIGTEKGNKIIAENKALFRAADALQLEKKEQNRAKVEKLLEEMNSQYKIRKDLSIIHKTNLRNKVWRELTKNCVECSACNFVCPTCT